MTALEIKKAQLLSEIDSEEILEKLQKYLKRLKGSTSKLPAQFKTEKELYASIDRAERDIKAGRVTSQEDMEKLAGICE